MNIWLLDIDGVLVQARGYREAMRASVNHFSRRMGLGDQAPSDDDVDLFEACGLINEWDSVPMCVAALVHEAWRLAPGLLVSADLDRTLAAIQTAGLMGAQADYRALARRIAGARRAGEAPSQTGRRLLMSDAVGLGRLAGSLDDLAAVMQVLLGDTDSVEASPTTFVFQHYSLGSRQFAATFERDAALETESLLARHDKPALSPAWRDRILALVASSRLRAAVFTARPSSPPRQAGSPAPAPPTVPAAVGLLPRRMPAQAAPASPDMVLSGRTLSGAYAPEAEIAVQMVGLTDLPLVGYGRIQWLASQVGREPETLVKPSPVHALAAIGASIHGREAESLSAAYTLAETGRLTGPLADLRGAHVTISVFEDTFGGVRAVRRAASLLSEHGVDTRAEAYGIAANPDKAAALEAENALVYGTLNEALESACTRAHLCE